jgi:antitoxin CptB
LKKDLKQLKFRCEHRGMREMDILMGGFFNMFFEEFSKEDIFQIDKYIIPLSDNDLYKCFLGEIIWPKDISDSLSYKLNIFSKKRGLTDS